MTEESRSPYPLRVTGGVLAVTLLFMVIFTWEHELWAPAVAAIALFAWSLFLLWFHIRTRTRPASNPTLVLLLLLPAWGAIQLLFRQTVYPFETWLSTLLLSAAACAYWLASESFQLPDVRQLFRIFLLILGGAVSVLAIVQMLTSDGRIYWLVAIPYDPDPLGPFRNRDRYAAFIEMLLPMVAAEAIQSQEKSLFWAVNAALMYGSVIAGGSRAGSIVVTIEVLLVAFLFTRRREFAEPRRLKAGATIVLGVAFATALGWGLVMQRFHNESQIFDGRRQLLISSIRMWHERPLGGFGLGAWPSVYPRFAIFDPGALVNHAHNDWMEWADDGGLPFVLLYFLVAWRAARLAWKSPAALGVLAVFLHSLFDFNFREYSLVLLVSVLLAFAETPEPATE